MVPVSEIRTEGLQLRASPSPATVSDYAEALRDGAVFPPVTVFFDGTDYWLADGHHRLGAHVEAKLTEISATVESGTFRDALLAAAGANATNALNRTAQDKRHAVETLLLDPEWRAWSDREIADRAKVSHPFVAKVRREMDEAAVNGNVSVEPQSERSFVNKHGSVSTRRVTPSQPKSGSIVGDFLKKLPDDVIGIEFVKRGLNPENYHA
ncbi:MAG: ParB/RepB/Spo0J family partition protein [Rhodospirillaceae bacterium]